MDEKLIFELLLFFLFSLLLISLAVVIHHIVLEKYKKDLKKELKAVEEIRKQQNKDEEKKREQKERFNNSIASDSYILERIRQQLSRIILEKTETEWHKNGHNPRKQNGAYRVDFERAVQQKMHNADHLGVTANSVLQYIHERGQNPLNKDVDAVIRKAIDGAICKAEERLNNNFSGDGISPSEFFARRTAISGDSVGVYIILNRTKSKYYVGQAKRLYFRVNQHFTGHGNGDVYADYKYGDQFRIKLITLRESGYDDLDKLERDLIRQYHANIDGYNKTSGNHSQ